MLVTTKQMIEKAQKGGYAIGSFNTSDLEITKAIIAAAEKLNSPVIIGTSERAIGYAGLESLSALVIALAKKAKVPVALHLDHGKTLDMVSKCLEVGYTSIMFDGSSYPIFQNELYTKEAVQVAHQNNVPCEGELGHIQSVGTDKNVIEKSYTDPKMVKEYVKKTNVDFLAVAIGSSHGNIGDEKLNIELLKKIRKETNVPLVLHGGSGVPDEDVTLAVKNGICKINVDTDIRHTFSKAIYDIGKEVLKNEDPRDIMGEVMLKIQKIIEEKIILFGSDGKA